MTDPESFWRQLCNGIDAITEVPPSRFDLASVYDPRTGTPGRIACRYGAFLDGIDEFDAGFFGISPREAVRMDPQQRLLLEVGWEALEDAGAPQERLPGDRIGVFLGMMANDYEDLMNRDPETLDFFSLNGAGRYGASGRLAFCLGLEGPSMTVDTACSSSLVSVHLACQSVRTRECDVAVAGGSHLILQPHVSISLSQGNILARDGRCKFGDASADGFGRGEGVGLVVLRPLADALASGDRIYAVIRGSAVNSDGASQGAMGTPSRAAQMALLAQAYRTAGIPSSRVDYVEAHGTGSGVADRVELEALGGVLAEGRSADHPCRVGSIKTNIGHTEGASGVAGLIKIALCLYHREIPQSLHFQTPNPYIPWERLPLQIQRQREPWPRGPHLAVGAVNSFGLSGTNAHIVLEEFSRAAARPGNSSRGEAFLLPICGRSPEALRTLATSYRELLAEPENLDLADLAAAAALRRSHVGHRLAVVASSREELREHLQTFLLGESGQSFWIGFGSSEPPAGTGEQIRLMSSPEASDRRSMLTSLAELYAAGHSIAWDQVYTFMPDSVRLPRHPWQRERFWLELPTPPAHPASVSRRPAEESFGGLSRELLLASAPPERGPLVEEHLRSEIASVLRLSHSRFDELRTLTQLGLDSLMALDLKSRIEARLGCSIPLVRLLQGMRLHHLVGEVLETIERDGANEEAWRAFLASRGATGGKLPVIVPDPARRYEPFPLTEIQQAYLAGRGEAYALGQVACQAYFEYESGNLDLERLERALQGLIARHDMLRAVFLNDGQQQILEAVPPYVIEITDLREACPAERAERLEEIRDEVSTQVRSPERWPLFEVRATRLEDGKVRLHLCFDLLILDAASIFSALFQEWADLYDAPDTPGERPDLSFRDYVLTELADRPSDSYARSERYWLNRLETLPPAPELPLAKDPAEVRKPHFVRFAARLSAERWSRLKSRAAAAGLTPSGALCAAYAEVISAWSKRGRFTLTLPVFGRFASHPDLAMVLGDFTSTVLLEVDGDPGGFEVRALRLQERLAEALEHSRFSGVRVLRELQRRRDREGSSPPAVVFTSLFGHRGFRDEPPAAWLGELVWGTSQTPQVLLDHHLLEERGELRFNWDVVLELFPAGVVEDMFAAYCALLGRLADEDVSWTQPLLLTPAAHLAIYAEANATAAPVPEGLLHAPFEQRAMERPEAPAVVSSGLVLTYGELRHRAGALAHVLREAGARPGRLVAVVMEKGWEQIVAVLGVLGSGAAYLPVSPDLPADRLRWILQHGQVELVLTQPGLDGTLAWPEGVRRLCIERSGEVPAVPPPASVQRPEDVAYVIYTSGSTGAPKGVVIDHRSALNTIVDINERFAVGPEDRVLALSSLSFDLSVYDIFGVLAAGGTIVMPEPWAGRDPARWLEWMRGERVTLWNTVPTLMQMLVEYTAGRAEELPGSLRLVLLSGDWIPLTLPDQIKELAGGARIVSLGGATEASIWSILFPVESVDPGWRSIPYGRAMVNQTFHVLDDRLEPRPVLVTGDLYIGGSGLAQGYWRDEEKTSSSFILHPRTGERLYRTGDLGRWSPEGCIEFLGREDLQVKVQGHRIELGEVEAALLQHPGVRAAVAMVAGDPRGHRRLVGYVVPREPAGPGAQEVRAFLAGKLPEAMVPSELVFLPELPLTPNGKVDRRALPAPGEPAVQGRQESAAPRTPLERRVGTLWGEVLGLREVGLHDDFLRLGGNSLLAIRLYTRLRKELGVELPMRTLLRSGTVAKLAEAVATQRAEGMMEEEPLPVLRPAPESRHEPFPLTDIQQAYWIGRTGAFELGNVAPHGYLELECRDLDLGRFQKAWQRLIQRHDMLRAVVLPDGVQKVLEQVPDYEIGALDLRGCGDSESERELMVVRHRMSHQVFAVDRWPLFEIRASLLNDQRVRLHIGLDLLIGDAWSMVRLVQELADLYEHPNTELPPLEMTFRDYVLTWVELEHSPRYERSLAYWRDRLTSLPAAPDLPLVCDPGSLERPRFARRSATLDPDAWKRLQAGAARAGLTPSSLLLSAFAEALAAWSKSPRFTLNTTLFNRLPIHPQVNDVVGDFTSMILVEVDLSGADDFETRARRFQEQLWQDLDHRYVSGIQVLRELARMRGERPRAAMPVVFTSTLIEGGGGDRSGLQWFRLGEPIYSVSQTPQVWLDHQVFEDRGALLLHWDAVEELFPAGLLDEMWTAYVNLLSRLAEFEGAWNEEPRLTPPPHLALYAAVNATEVPLPEGLLHTPFLRQAAERPDHPAVICSDRMLTYGQLRRRASGLARQLRNLGARPGHLVAVVMEKGWEQVVAVLAVLEAGSAYLPINPEQPRERLAWMLEHGQVELVLTQPHLDGALDWPAGARRLLVGPDTEAPDAAPLDPVQSPDDIAYVIYTSGSTGRPKGVVIEHRAALNSVADINRRFGIGPADRVLALSRLSFDLSVWDIFGILAAGGTIVMPEPWAGRDPACWLDWMARAQITVWNSVPALMEMLAEHVEARFQLLPDSLRLVLMSGDWIPLGLPDRLRALAPQARAVSLGGATEASIWSILHPIEVVQKDWRSIPYGRAMANQTFHVLDERLEPRPLWVPGDLYIGGIGLAREYWRDEEKTRGSFVLHPRTGERLYRTGDLGRWLPEGNIEFLGREDFQVKIQGYRIELGEIEAALLQHESVRAAVVAAVGDPRGPRRLVAYVAGGGDGEAPPAGVPMEVFGGSDEGVLTDPLERLAFKMDKPGFRKLPPREGVVGLAAPAPAEAAARLRRRSHRDFLAAPLPLQSLGQLLSCLAPLEIEGLPRYRYASAGGLYPVQTYLYVRPGRVAGLAGGTYYYHPGESALIPLALEVEIEADLHAPVNRPTFEGSAFSIFLVGELAAIEPLYGHLARDFCRLEAGYMSQLLMETSGEAAIGLCPVGGFQVDRIQGLLALEETHVPLHSLIGGPIDPAWVETLPGSKTHASIADPAPRSWALELREFLVTRLPEHMIPAAFVAIGELPLTANGKIDRGRLPAPEAPEACERVEHIAPRSDLEGKLVDILQQVTGVARIGVLDNFFHLGANSVHMVQLNNRLCGLLGREIPILDMFRFSNISGLASHLSEVAPEPPAFEASIGRAEERLAERARRREARRRHG
jgi:amino acid adenylation domain-containing protein